MNYDSLDLLAGLLSLNGDVYTIKKNENGEIVFSPKKTITNSQVYKDFQKKVKEINDDELFKNAAAKLRTENSEYFSILNSTPNDCDEAIYEKATVAFDKALKETVVDRISEIESEIDDLYDVINELKETYNITEC